MGNIAAVMGADTIETIGAQQQAEHTGAMRLQQLYDAPAYGEPVCDEPISIHVEKYAHSTRLLKAVGHIMLRETVDAPERSPVVERLHAEYQSAILEMLNTDPDFRDQLEINSEDTYQIIGGKIIVADGKTSLEELVGDGAKASRSEASTDKRMEIQAVRDETDLLNIRAAQNLRPGQGRITLSMDPKEAFAKGKDFWEGLGMLGYREGLAFMQWAYRVDESQIVLGTYSVDTSDIATWRDIQSKHALDIPATETTSTWHAHAHERAGTLEEVRTEVLAMRSEFYAARDITTKRYSVNDFMRLNQETIDTAFDLLYVPLTRSQASGVKDPVIHALVGTLLSQPEALNEETIAELNHVYKSTHFDDAATRLLDHCIRYGVVERLRTGLEALVSGRPAVVKNFVESSSSNISLSNVAQIVRNMSGNILIGNRAGRVYGGCTASRNTSASRSDRKGKKNNVDPDPSSEGAEGDENDVEEDAVPTELRCPECEVTSDTKAVITTDREGNEIWLCPCCGFWADVCTGQTGFRDKPSSEQQDADKHQETVVAELFRALGFNTKAFALDTARSTDS